VPKLFGEKNGMWKHKQSEAAKQAISAARKNKKWIYDPLTQQQKSVDVADVPRYVSLGWKLGRIKYQKEPSFLLSF
jgi:hypothetical protein